MHNWEKQKTLKSSVHLFSSKNWFFDIFSTKSKKNKTTRPQIFYHIRWDTELAIIDSLTKGLLRGGGLLRFITLTLWVSVKPDM